jgi:hypothetical protein
MQLADAAIAPKSANTQTVLTTIGLFGLGGVVGGVLIARLLDVVARSCRGGWPGGLIALGGD